MIFEDLQALRRRIGEVTRREAPARPVLHVDTTQFMDIDAGSILRLDGNDYLVVGQAREGRFGIDDQPKFWVKFVADLTYGDKKIIKLVFHERFDSRVGPTVFHCLRSAEKEAAVLHRMRGHPNFMQGGGVADAVGNVVRVIDFVSGPSLYDYLRRLQLPHEVYYRRVMPAVMQAALRSFEAIRDLHDRGMHHGDIRADHLIVSDHSDTYVWIDFDYEIDAPVVYDVTCLGNVLQQVVGKGRHSLHDIRLRPADYPDFRGGLTSADMSLMYPHRVANLRKLFPHISEALNAILIRYAAGAAARYTRVASLIADLRRLFPADAPNAVSAAPVAE